MCQSTFSRRDAVACGNLHLQKCLREDVSILFSQALFLYSISVDLVLTVHYTSSTFGGLSPFGSSSKNRKQCLSHGSQLFQGWMPDPRTSYPPVQCTLRCQTFHMKILKFTFLLINGILQIKVYPEDGCHLQD